MDHTAAENDCFINIADRYGFSWKTLWNHPNNAELRQKRKDPYLLYAGDVVHVPERDLKEVERATEKRHRFKKITEMVLLRLRLLEDGEPRRNLSYTLEVEGLTFKGKTDGNGKLEHRIPARATVGRLITAEDNYLLDIGRLDPVTEIAGVQQRLSNLGYLGHESNGIVTEETRAALQAFQEKHGLEANGEITEQTRNSLTGAHGT
jgi:murein L,D-transpeptidase YcbB/YkuD